MDVIVHQFKFKIQSNVTTTNKRKKKKVTKGKCVLTLMLLQRSPTNSMHHADTWTDTEWNRAPLLWQPIQMYRFRWIKLWMTRRWKKGKIHEIFPSQRRKKFIGILLTLIYGHIAFVRKSSKIRSIEIPRLHLLWMRVQINRWIEFHTFIKCDKMRHQPKVLVFIFHIQRECWLVAFQQPKFCDSAECWRCDGDDD